VTTGEVVGHQRERDTEATAGFVDKPVIQFRDRLGPTRRFVGAVRWPDEQVAIGSAVRIRFQPDAPGNAKRDSLALQCLPALAVLASGAFLCFALVQMVRQ